MCSFIPAISRMNPNKSFEKAHQTHLIKLKTCHIKPLTFVEKIQLLLLHKHERLTDEDIHD